MKLLALLALLLLVSVSMVSMRGSVESSLDTSQVRAYSDEKWKYMLHQIFLPATKVDLEGVQIKETEHGSFWVFEQFMFYGNLTGEIYTRERMRKRSALFTSLPNEIQEKLEKMYAVQQKLVKMAYCTEGYHCNQENFQKLQQDFQALM